MIDPAELVLRGIILATLAFAAVAIVGAILLPQSSPAMPPREAPPSSLLPWVARSLADARAMHCARLLRIVQREAGRARVQLAAMPTGAVRAWLGDAAYELTAPEFRAEWRTESGALRMLLSRLRASGGAWLAMACDDATITPPSHQIEAVASAARATVSRKARAARPSPLRSRPKSEGSETGVSRVASGE